MTAATLARPRRGASRRRVAAIGYRCEAHGHPLDRASVCPLGDSPAVEWTSRLSTDYARVTWAADEATRGSLPFRFEELPERYDRERWPNTSPGELALALSYYQRWGNLTAPRPKHGGTVVVRPPTPYQDADGRWCVDCACGQTCVAPSYVPNTEDEAGMALSMHVFVIASGIGHGRDSLRDVPGHTRHIDAGCVGAGNRALRERVNAGPLDGSLRHLQPLQLEFAE